ncbi:DUF3093 domain-containing protein [Streptomyces spongiicola]|uniref:DUF3093 domain-containing protein n=1 Tax=Streptomyces spongiicola TaxID=1690221 RepID=A0A2S1Z5E1_9ACTN|nr:DUF3093 domain-containing protein [Streptomyces spongiicola]AWK11577.1 DUF3093 domain-containing protein [Streptomyces spongiicola]GBP98704.1 DUF3093 domain-containing protein [Streptomyces spongiicola]
MQPSPAEPGIPAAPRFDERLTVPRAWWLITALVAVSGGLVLLPLGPVPMLGGLIAAGAVAAAGVSSYGSARIRVVADSLVAGDARIPVPALGEPEVLDAQEARAWRSYKADPRAFMLLRSYVPTAVRVPVTDPQDPTPYLYLSTRDPRGLVAALEAARGG